MEYFIQEAALAVTTGVFSVTHEFSGRMAIVGGLEFT